jgi:hypothetical protein
MSHYKFLLKPLFFIFNLIFATCLVLWIEKLSPSDLGRFKSVFENAPPPSEKDIFMELCRDYKNGTITQAQFDERLDLLFNKKEGARSVSDPGQVKKGTTRQNDK